MVWSVNIAVDAGTGGVTISNSAGGVTVILESLSYTVSGASSVDLTAGIDGGSSYAFTVG